MKAHRAVSNRAVLLMTLFFNAVIGVVVVVLLENVWRAGHLEVDTLKTLCFSAVVFVIILSSLISWCLAPKSYLIEPGLLRVQPNLGPTFKFRLTADCAISQPGHLDNLKRTFGNGGVYGIYGLFVDDTAKKHRLFLRTSEGPFVCVANEKLSCILSAKDNEALLADLMAARLPAGTK